jgi:hypothetical protein
LRELGALHLQRSVASLKLRLLVDDQRAQCLAVLR